MKIGEFAKVCNTKISVLRHYDKQNLLRPIYIDKFTGYRYYSQEQISIFFRITALKEAGFTSIAVYGDRKFTGPAEGEQRIYLKARKGKIK